VDKTMTDGCPCWHYPARPIRLAPRDVHIWRAFPCHGATFIDQLAPLLSEDELSRAASFRFESDRNRFIVCRAILRNILGLYLGIGPEHVKFRMGPLGKPYPANESGGVQIQFSLSHTHHIALYAFTSNRRIGVDIEQVRTISNLDQVAAFSFSDYENHVFRSLRPDRKEAAFYNCWTRKEAYVKAIGEGLSSPFRAFDVSLSPDEPCRLLRINGSADEALLWSMETLEPAPDHVAAVVVEKFDYHMNRYEWKFDQTN